jgi:hypothetical protein
MDFGLDGMIRMDEMHLCISCGADLVGPFQPKLALNMVRADETEESNEIEITIYARSWLCPGCGLLHWHAGDEQLEQLREVVGADVAPKPDQSYQRRMQMLHMLKRVRRI